MGGAERVVVDVVNGLNPDYFAPIICCIRKSGPCANLIRKKDVKIIEMFHGEGNDLSLPIKMARLILSVGADIIHSHGWGVFCESALAAWFSGTPLIHTVHGYRYEDLFAKTARARIKRWIRHQMERLLSFFADQITVVDESLIGAVHLETRIPFEKILYIPNGVKHIPSTMHRTEMRRTLDISPAAQVVCSVGRLAKVKNFPCLILAMEKVVSQMSNVTCLIIGEGDEREALQQLIQTCHLQEKVRLLGHREDVQAILAASDIFVLPSFFEGTSMAILEAMSNGLPVICTNVGGNKNLIRNGINGVLVSPDHPTELLEAIVSLCSDPAKGRHLGETGQKDVAERFDLNKIILVYEGLYGKILPQRDARGDVP